jgi:hypothetical protein
MKKSTLFLVVILLLSVRLIAQDAPKVKFEKVPEEDLAMKTYPADSSAEAVILYDNGSSYVKYDVDHGFRLTYDRFVRIKILKQSGVNWGDFRFSLYSNGQNLEEMSGINGTTFNLENGKTVKSELKKSAIFKERESKYWESVRLSMPSVKVGSVIDLKYRISTDLVRNLRTWKFQYTIPVKWSQYSVIYPEYFNYNQSYQGYHRLLYNKQSNNMERIQYTVNEEVPTSTNKNITVHEITNQTISYLAHEFDYAAKDVPALKLEPYLTSLENYTTQIKFELASTDFMHIGGTVKSYATSWDDIAMQLKMEDNFGLQLKNNNFADVAAIELTKNTTDEMKKLELIYSHLQHTMKWDGSKSVFTSKNLKKAYSDKTGNSADINLLLVVMLNSAGIYSDPVILSTRSNGIISPANPSLSSCNYVIVRAVIDKKPILLDATEPNLQIGYIPSRCLNGSGHLITNEVSKVVPLLNPKSIDNTNVQLALINGKMSGTLQKQLAGQDAFDLREGIKSAGSKQEHFNKLKNSSADLDYLESEYSDIDSLSKPLQVNYKIALKESQEKNAGIIYIDPVIVDRMKVNPFTSPERAYPVDYGSPFMKMYNFQLTVPAGYNIDEIPQSKTFALPGNGGTFVYQITKVEDKISLSLRLSIDKALFLPEEYPLLKAFYDIVISNEAQQIVLKKNS